MLSTMQHASAVMKHDAACANVRAGILVVTSCLACWFSAVCNHVSHFVLFGECNAMVTCEIKLFQNYFRDLLQLMNIFQHVQCR